jgi:hypothetical protein
MPADRIIGGQEEESNFAHQEFVKAMAKYQKKVFRFFGNVCIQQ